MENVHKTSLRPWISRRINVREFQNQWTLSLSNLNKLSLENLKSSMDAESFSKISKECGLEAMKSKYQDRIDVGKNLVIPENVDLQTLRLQKADLEKRENDPQYDAFVYINNKYHNYPSAEITETDAISSTSFTPVPEPNVLLTVQLYRPEQRYNNYTKHQLSRFPVFQIDQEFMVLGSQCLTDLRDKIDCVSDKAIPGDCSETPDATPEVTCKDLYKSGFFYIDGTFYNDMRHPDCRDYSEVIMKWAEVSNRGIGPFKKAPMEGTSFVDLEMQLGCPYVYVHQGNCEHLMVFTDLIMYTKHYCDNLNQYPLYTTLKQKKRIFCMVCRTHMTDWVVYDSKRVPETPFFFCKQCFTSFNYDENNEKIGHFRAYHHIDRGSIL